MGGWKGPIVMKHGGRAICANFVTGELEGRENSGFVKSWQLEMQLGVSGNELSL